jgi:hypothetical protein
VDVPNACLRKGRNAELFVQNFYVRKLGAYICHLQIVYRDDDASVPFGKWSPRSAYGQFRDGTNL